MADEPKKPGEGTEKLTRREALKTTLAWGAVGYLAFEAFNRAGKLAESQQGLPENLKDTMRENAITLLADGNHAAPGVQEILRRGQSIFISGEIPGRKLLALEQDHKHQHFIDAYLKTGDEAHLDNMLEEILKEQVEIESKINLTPSKQSLEKLDREFQVGLKPPEDGRPRVMLMNIDIIRAVYAARQDGQNIDILLTDDSSEAHEYLSSKGISPENIHTPEANARIGDEFYEIGRRRTDHQFNIVRNHADKYDHVLVTSGISHSMMSKSLGAALIAVTTSDERTPGIYENAPINGGGRANFGIITQKYLPAETFEKIVVSLPLAERKKLTEQKNSVLNGENGLESLRQDIWRDINMNPNIPSEEEINVFKNVSIVWAAAHTHLWEFGEAGKAMDVMKESLKIHDSGRMPMPFRDETIEKIRSAVNEHKKTIDSMAQTMKKLTKHEAKENGRKNDLVNKLKLPDQNKGRGR